VSSWQQFAVEAPELSERGRRRLESTGLCLVGTLRRDGSPRISPVEPLILDGELYLGMMWQSWKARDLERDPRCVLHSTVSDKNGQEGDLKLYGRAVGVDSDDERSCYRQALQSLTGWAPSGERWHLFRLDIDQAAWFQVVPPDGHDIKVWRPGSAPELRTCSE